MCDVTASVHTIIVFLPKFKVWFSNKANFLGLLFNTRAMLTVKKQPNPQCSVVLSHMVNTLEMKAQSQRVSVF